MAAVSCAPSESANLLITDNGRQKSFSQRFCRLLNETMVFFFHNSLGYAIMLSVMVYSGWLFLAVILGMSLGYFVFGHITMKVNMESIQTRTTKVLCSPACPEAGTSTGIGMFILMFEFTEINHTKMSVHMFSDSKSTTPCQSDSNEYCQQPPATISGACYENKVVCEAQVSGPTYTEVVNDENCCCRL